MVQDVQGALALLSSLGVKEDIRSISTALPPSLTKQSGNNKICLNSVSKPLTAQINDGETWNVEIKLSEEAFKKVKEYFENPSRE